MFNIGFAAIDGKEVSMHNQLVKLNTSDELIDAVKKKDIALAA